MRRSSRGLAVSAAIALAGAVLAPGLAAAAAPNTASATGSVSIAFASNTIPLGVASPITVTLSEQNPGHGIYMVATITLPPGFTVANPVTGSAPCLGFYGSVGSTTPGFTLDTQASDAACTETVDVVASTPGGATVSLDAFDSSAGVHTSGSTWVDVVAPATINAAFGTSTLDVGGSTSLTFTITNPNSAVVVPSLAGRAIPNGTAGALSGVGFSDTLPAGLVVATPNGLSSTCGGTAGAIAGGATVSLVGGVLATGASCTVVVNVTAVTPGTQQDSSGQVSSTEGGNGAASGTSLTVNAPAPSPTPIPTPTPAPTTGTATPAPTVTLPPTTAATPPSGPVGPSGELLLLGLSLGLAAAWFAIGYRRQMRRS